MVLPKQSFLHNIDPRIKLIAGLLFIVSAVSLQRILHALVFFSFFAAVSCLAGFTLKNYLKRMTPPFFIVVMIVILQSFLTGSTVVFSLFGLSFYYEGFLFGLLIAGRTASAVSILNLIMATTTQEDVFASLRFFRVPYVFVDLLALISRYVVILSMEAFTMYIALQSRLGFSRSLSYRRMVENFGIMGSQVFVKSLERSERLYNSLVSRGYTMSSQIVSQYFEKLKIRDWSFLATSLVACLFVFSVNCVL